MWKNSCEGQDGKKSGESEGEATVAAGENKLLRHLAAFMATGEYQQTHNDI